ncbi:MAG: hypothetical protein J6S09_03050 [Paludibacteraceae bacterium]|nr:hypothetical protein [Paludibacteraceae bacterium]
MENYNLIIAGVIGSTITLFLTAIIDFIKEKYRTKIEMQKLVFHRKTDAVERAISWYQEAIDCYRMMQTACDALEEEYNPTTYSRLVASFAQAGRLYENTSKVLNPIYLYYNFSDIESKYDIQYSWEYINFTIKELGKLDQQVLKLYNQGLTDDSNEIKTLRTKALDILKKFAIAIDVQITIITEIMSKLREEYQKI